MSYQNDAPARVWHRPALTGQLIDRVNPARAGYRFRSEGFSSDHWSINLRDICLVF